jgi:arylsulfatase A-like enzyme
MYEGGIRTPAIARWPGKIRPGVVSDQVWVFWDFLPTMAELTGQPTPVGLDGISILPVLLGSPAMPHPPLYWEFHQRGFDQGARIGDWKAVRHGRNKPIELYDLKADVGEKQDVAAEHPDVVERFDDFFKTARVDSEIWPINENLATKKPAKGKTQ